MKGSVVLISSIPWNFTWQRHHEVAAGLANRGYRVSYVEPFPKRWPRLHEWRRVRDRLWGNPDAAAVWRQPLAAGVTFFPVRTVPDVGRIGQWLNRTVTVPRLHRAMQKKQHLARPLIAINYLPAAASIALQDSLAADVNIYDCVVDWINSPYANGLGHNEPDLVERSDLVFADSPFLVQKMERLHESVTQILPAVDFERFGPARHSGQHILSDKPLCCYFGDVGIQVDLELLKLVSLRYSLRLVGPVRGDLSAFGRDTEVTGSVPYDRVPALLSDVDVLLLPYTQQKYVQGLIPAKTFECLATGKPTVVFGLTSLSKFAEYFYLSESYDHFLENIELAMSEEPSQRKKRLQVAQANTWPARIDEIEAAIENELARKRSL